MEIIGETYSITFNGRKYYFIDVGTGAFAFTKSEWEKLKKNEIRKKGLFGKVMKVTVSSSLKKKAYKKYLSLLKHSSVVKKLNKIYKK